MYGGVNIQKGKIYCYENLRTKGGNPNNEWLKGEYK